MIHLLGTKLSGQALLRKTTERHCFERDKNGLRGLAPDSGHQHHTQHLPGNSCYGLTGVEKHLGTFSNYQVEPERRTCLLLHPVVKFALQVES